MPLEFTQFVIDKDVRIRVDRDLDISIPDHNLAYDDTLVALGGKKTSELIAIDMIENRPLIHLIPNSGLSYTSIAEYTLDAIDHIIDHFSGSITPLHKYQQRVKEHTDSVRECLFGSSTCDASNTRRRNLEVGLRNILGFAPNEILESGHALTGHIRNVLAYISYESENSDTQEPYKKSIALALDEVVYYTFSINDSIPSWFITVARNWHEREHRPFGNYSYIVEKSTTYHRELVWLCDRLLDYVEGKR